MTDQPGGGTPGDEPDKRPDNPFAGTPFEAWAAGGGQGMPDLAAIFSQLSTMMSWKGGPINWDLALETAKQTIRESGDASLTAAERATVDETVRLSEHWLDEATDLPAGSAGKAAAWNRAEWLEGTLPAWKKLVEPLAVHIVNAMGQAMPQEAAPGMGQLSGMFTQFGGAMFGAQVGQGLGQLATEVFGGTDIGLPLSSLGHPVLLPGNIAKFGEGLEVPDEDVRLYLALREAAHQRLFRHASWLSAHLFTAVEEWARGMKVDMSNIENLAGQLDMSNPEALAEALNSGKLEPEDTPQQRAALSRLETALALVEGWVEDVVTQATAGRMPSAVQLQEAVRRRRAVGGPAEQTFATLVGLELRPRRVREAARLWALLRESRGTAGREALWEHPDLMPSAANLDDPDGFVRESNAISELDFDDIGDLGFDQPREQPGDDDPGKPSS
jgi:putative hydrolase